MTVVEADRDSHVALAIEPGIGREGYRIEATPAGVVRVVGHDERGLLYGVGKLLRTSRYHEEAVSLSSWRGVSVPRYVSDPTILQALPVARAVTIG